MDVLFPEAVTMIIMTEYKVDRDQIIMNFQYVYSCMPVRSDGTGLLMLCALALSYIYTLVVMKSSVRGES